MKELRCPTCAMAFVWKELKRDDLSAAPRRFGLAWPRVYCPHCGVQLRSSFGSLFTYGLVACVSIILFSANWFFEGVLSKIFYMAGLLLLLASGLIAFKSHQFVSIGQPKLKPKNDTWHGDCAE